MRACTLSCAVLGVAIIFHASASVHAQSLLHRYSFNDGTANDSVGTANGSLGSGSGADIAVGGLVVYSSGCDVGVGLPLSATSGISSSFTLEDWFTRSNSSTDQSTIFSFGSSTADYLIVHAQSPNVSPAGLTADFRTDNSFQLISASAEPEGSEHLITISYSAATSAVSLYLDGSLESSGTISGGFNLSQIAGGGFNGLGSFDAWDDGASPGTTDEFRIWSGALSARQIEDDAGDGPNLIGAPEPSALALVAAGGLALFSRPRSLGRKSA